MTVQFAKTVLFVMVAVLLAVATSHCKLEAIPALEFLACAETEAEEGTESHCEDEACATVEDGLYFQQQAQPLAVKVVTILPFELSALVEDRESELFEARTIIDTSPQSPPSWQFVYRTALPVRAPSFVS